MHPRVQYRSRVVAAALRQAHLLSLGQQAARGSWPGGKISPRRVQSSAQPSSRAIADTLSLGHTNEERVIRAIAARGAAGSLGRHRGRIRGTLPAARAGVARSAGMRLMPASIGHGNPRVNSLPAQTDGGCGRHRSPRAYGIFGRSRARGLATPRHRAAARADEPLAHRVHIVVPRAGVARLPGVLRLGHHLVPRLVPEPPRLRQLGAMAGCWPGVASRLSGSHRAPTTTDCDSRTSRSAGNTGTNVLDC